MQLRTIAAGAALCLLMAGAAQAKMVHFMAKLSGAAEVPANTSAATGEVTGMLDTDSKMLTYNATYSGLSGPAGAAHFHSAATPGGNGPPVVPVANAASPISGTATLTDAQIGDLMAGRWYFNVHTAAHPGGEIRGWLKAE